MDDKKPNPLIRDQIINEDFKILTPDQIQKLHGKKLEQAQQYYVEILETLCGKQVWNILEALAAVEHKMQVENSQKQLKYLNANSP
jgi:hypothetical protein